MILTKKGIERLRALLLPQIADSHISDEDVNSVCDMALGALELWQPIETAPKDGTKILIAGRLNEGFYIDSVKWASHGYHDGWVSDDDDAMDGTFFIDPTHWQPLPAPPEDSAKEKV